MALVEQLLRRVDYQVNKNWGRHPTLGRNPTHLRQARKSNLKTSSSKKVYILLSLIHCLKGGILD